ncbi:MAG: hypothetical protein ACM3W4_01580 [Ignavibacteriales bacterium]
MSRFPYLYALLTGEPHASEIARLKAEAKEAKRLHQKVVPIQTELMRARTRQLMMECKG